MSTLWPESETDKLKWNVKSCFYKWVITDPYPEQTFYKSLPPTLRVFSDKPEEISIHQAWREGYEFAKELVTKELE